MGCWLGCDCSTLSVGVLTVPVCFPKGGNFPSTPDLTPAPRPPTPPACQPVGDLDWDWDWDWHGWALGLGCCRALAE